MEKLGWGLGHEKRCDLLNDQNNELSFAHGIRQWSPFWKGDLKASPHPPVKATSCHNSFIFSSIHPSIHLYSLISFPIIPFVTNTDHRLQLWDL